MTRSSCEVVYIADQMWRIWAGACCEEDYLKTEITKEFTFEAAHHLPGVGPGHKCFGLHGHLFRVEVTVAGEVDPRLGWVMDFGELAARGRELMAQLDHKVLNDLPGLDCPTSERLAEHLFGRFRQTVPGVAAVTVHESPTSRCTFRPGPVDEPVGARIHIVEGGDECCFSAAHCLLYPPDGREPLHGHDYVVRISATVEPGAAILVEDVIRSAAREVILMLDHRLLLPERPAIGRLEREERVVSLVLPWEKLQFPSRDVMVLDVVNTTTEALAGWLAARLQTELSARLPGMTSLTVGLREGRQSWASVRVEEQDD